MAAPTPADLQPPASIKPAARQRPLLRAVRLFRPYWPQVAAAGLLILVTAGLGAVTPVLVKAVFDSALFPNAGPPNMMLLWVLVGAMAAIAIVNGVMGGVQAYITHKMGQNVMGDLQDAVYAHLQGMSLRFFTGTRTGEIQSRVSNDVSGIQSVVSNTLTDTVSSIVIIVSTVIAMAILSWQFTLVALAMLPFFFILTTRVGRRRREVMADAQRSMAQVTAVTQETLSVSGIMLAKLFGRQHGELHHFHRHNQQLSDLAVRQEMIAYSFSMAATTFLTISPALVYLLAGYLMSWGGASIVTAGTIIAFTALQSRLYNPVERLLQVSVELQSSLALFERIFEYLDLQPEIVDSPSARPLEQSNISGEIAFDSVRVGNWLPGTGGMGNEGAQPTIQWTLDGVSFRILPGQLAAFVGPSGAGKSTIACMVPRLYDATEGSVSIDGVDVREVRLADLSRVIGFVTQENYLFHGSIERNLLYSRPEATHEDVVSAAKAAYIHDRIMELPEGYDTVVGERGFRLSGGERQRLSIARVILHQPSILVLDEATSALDTASERSVRAALQPLIHGRTTLVIAHRLSTIIAADVIYVVDRGRIVDHGRHHELLTRCGLYNKMYAEQFSGGRIEAHCQDGVVFSDGAIFCPEQPERLVAAAAGND